MSLRHEKPSPDSMVSALRQRASRSSGPPDAPSAAGAAGLPVVDDVVLGGAGLRTRAQAPGGGHARRLSQWARRSGLALSIAAGMVASAIGGALAAKSRSAPNAEWSAPVAGSASAAGRPASAASASASASALASAPVSASAAAAAVHSSPAHAASDAHSSTGGGVAPTAAVDPAAEGHGHAAASPAAAAAPALASIALAQTAVAPTPVPIEDLTFGLDLNGDGIPDALERYVRKTIATPATRVAARHYYRVALPLATRSQQGDVIAYADKQAVFRAAECYLLTANEDDVPDPPNLNDRAILIGAAAADRMQALAEALAGFNYRLAGAKRQACG